LQKCLQSINGKLLTLKSLNSLWLSIKNDSKKKKFVDILNTNSIVKEVTSLKAEKQNLLYKCAFKVGKGKPTN